MRNSGKDALAKLLTERRMRRTVVVLLRNTVTPNYKNLLRESATAIRREGVEPWRPLASGSVNATTTKSLTLVKIILDSVYKRVYTQ